MQFFLCVLVSVRFRVVYTVYHICVVFGTVTLGIPQSCLFYPVCTLTPSYLYLYFFEVCINACIHVCVFFVCLQFTSSFVIDLAWSCVTVVFPIDDYMVSSSHSRRRCPPHKKMMRLQSPHTRHYCVRTNCRTGQRAQPPCEHEHPCTKECPSSELRAEPCEHEHKQRPSTTLHLFVLLLLLLLLLLR